MLGQITLISGEARYYSVYDLIWGYAPYYSATPHIPRGLRAFGPPAPRVSGFARMSFGHIPLNQGAFAPLMRVFAPLNRGETLPAFGLQVSPLYRGANTLN